MNDHGTNVQCDKCKEWVSGSHNCDTWSMKCRECEGSGKVKNWIGDIEQRSMLPKPCPTCHGKRIEIEVEVRCTDCKGWRYHTICPKPYAGYPDKCNSAGKAYRPMTVEMVKGMTCSESEPQECPTKFDPKICYTCEYCNYKGAAVRIKGG